MLGDPKSILIAAVNKTTVTGSSTCCIASLSDTLNFANLGDSGFLLLRHSNNSLETVFKSSEQCHGFNFPYQARAKDECRLELAGTIREGRTAARYRLSAMTSLSWELMGCGITCSLKTSRGSSKTYSCMRILRELVRL
eukprot:TRINITY_DN5258_c0_g1_i1.p1 TRINITY_DN5258_c0_g1~~TRINITY_DN5258_c0_g1_i1.p1  ORF type:complete len:139 (+),score=8.74 TRINITY_DN5258_c0_g1_i1:418-834(+)